VTHRTCATTAMRPLVADCLLPHGWFTTEGTYTVLLKILFSGVHTKCGAVEMLLLRTHECAAFGGLAAGNIACWRPGKASCR
jgi:hypothetical protein